jgi:ABC-2 type transport system ATP-binding protein
MTDEAAIRTSGLGMTYNPGLFAAKKVGLSDLDMVVPQGSTFGYLGQNGAGKTSTIKILVGLQFPTAGQAWINGGNVLEAKSRRSIGFMPENPYFYEYLNAREALDFYGKLSGMDRTARQRRADELIAEFGLGHAKNTLLRNYSKGMRQRLGLAQAIIHDPPLVILDEPMSGLDPLGRRDIRNIILRLRDKGRTVFFSTHILSDVEEICDRVCVLNKGRKVAEGPLSTLLTGRVLEVKLSVSGLTRETAPKLENLATRCWHDGLIYHVLVDSDDKAQLAKAQLEKAGGVLRSMEQHKESLEEYFVRVTDNGQAAPPVSVPAGQNAVAEKVVEAAHKS